MGEIAKLPQQTSELSADIVESLVLDGDLGKMKPAQRVAYYVHRCRMLGIDPGEQPFQLIKLNGKLTLYATKSCANALTRVNRLSVEIKSTRVEDSLVIVEARACDAEGRFADDIGAIDLKAESLSKPNALMKCATKAKRRAVLSLVGLGVLDESEVDDIRGAERVRLNVQTGEIESAKEPDPTIIDTTAEPRAIDKLGPRCRGKAEGIARGNRTRTEELAKLLRVDDLGKAWERVLLRAEIDASKYVEVDGEATPSPESLTVDDGQIVRSWLEAKLATMRSQSTSPNEVANSAAVDSARARVLTTWRSLVDGAHVDPEGQADAFADWAGVESWPNEPSGQLWAACLSGLERWRSERGVQL